MLDMCDDPYSIFFMLSQIVAFLLLGQIVFNRWKHRYTENVADTKKT